MSSSASSNNTWKRLRPDPSLTSLCKQFTEMSISTLSDKRLTRKRLRRPDPSVTSLCNQFAEMWKRKRIEYTNEMIQQGMKMSSSSSCAPEKEESSSNPSAPEKEESSSNPSAPEKEESSSNPSAPKKEESSSNPSAPEKEESSSNSSAPEKEESSSNSSAPEKEESSSNSSAPQKEESSSNSSPPKLMASTSTTPIQKRFKYDVFLSFRGEDIRKTFLGHLYEALNAKGIYTYKDDVRIHKGKTISDELIKAIEDSRFYIIVFSKNYASSSWCLDELVKIIECQKKDEHTAYPVFYDVEPTEVRNQIGAVENAFSKNKEKEAAEKWKGALKEAADLAGWELKNTNDGHKAKFIKTIVQEISLELRSISFGSDEKLVGMETRVKDVVDSLEMGIDDDVWMIGIKGMGGAGKTTTARAVFEGLSADFEAKSFVTNVREVSNGSVSGLKNLQEQVLSRVLNEQVTLDSVYDGKNMMQERMRGIKVLLVLDDVDHIEQLEALAGGPNWFKPGSRIIVTTRNEQVLEAHRVNFRDIDLLSNKVDHRVKIRDIDLLSDEEAIFLLSRHAFGRASPSQGFEKLSEKVVSYAAGLPLTVKVLGSSLYGTNEHEWKDAIERLKEIPLKETLKQLELSYISLEDDYKEIFLDIACILKGEQKEEAIRILVCCGFHARIGLKVLEQRSLITVDKNGVLGMHDHIEEMGKNIVRREHPNEPNKHSRLWIKEEIEDILANDEGSEATMCLANAGTVMKGLGKMKQLRYLKVYLPNKDYYERHAEDLDNTAQYFSNSLKYLTFRNYPFLYLPKTFQANNLVGLDMYITRMKQLWEEGEKKVLPELKFLSLNYCSRLTTFDFSITPNLETLSLINSFNLVKLFMPVSCQKLNYLCISCSKLRTLDLGLTPNLEKLSLNGCADFEELHVSSACPNLKFLELRESSLRGLDLELFPNLERLDLEGCADFEELHVSSACPNLKFLELSSTRLRSLDLELFPNLEMLDLQGCDKLVEINAPVGCLRKLVSLNLDSCLRFSDFVVIVRGLKPKVSRSSASLSLVGKSLDLCPLHPNINLPKFLFDCNYEEDLRLSVGNIEKLISFGLCACTDFKKFSDMICSLQCLRKLRIKCDIPEFPEDLGKLECLEELCLSSTKIKHLPDSICMLKCLKSLKVNYDDNPWKTLYVRRNKIEFLLEKLPEDLGQLECLEELYVKSKKLEYLPDSICMLKRLKSLDVRDCSCLGKLPEGIGQLESLEILDLSATKIKHLPNSICMLKHLTYLNLRGCALLEKLPEDLGKLECLETLHVQSKKIEYLPDSICMLKCLKSLEVKNGDLLEKLPKDLGKLECLEQLCVCSKKIEYLPDSICKLKRLKLLGVADSSCLGKLPEDIGQLESLERLDLSATKIKHLPNSICMLKHLTYLNLRGCALLEKLPEDLGKLECLETLHVRSKKIEYLPDSICMLKRLKLLDVGDCSCLGKLPENIGQLESLERLDLSATKIKHLPNSIYMLKHLTYLNLRRCTLLEKLPEDLGRLKCLKELCLSSTQIEHLPDSICMLKNLRIDASIEFPLQR